MWNKIKQDFKERFLNFETAKGIYLLPAGCIVIYSAVFYIQFVIQVAAVLSGAYFVYEGFRKITVNRIKEGRAKAKLAKEREALDAGKI